MTVDLGNRHRGMKPKVEETEMVAIYTIEKHLHIFSHGFPGLCYSLPIHLHIITDMATQRTTSGFVRLTTIWTGFSTLSRIF